MKKLILQSILIITVFIFSGCLTVPVNPTARLVQKGTLESSFGMYHLSYSYYRTTYDSYNGKTSTSVEPVGLNLIILQARSRFDLENIDFGIGYNSFYIFGDVKFSPLNQLSSVLFALDGIIYFDLTGGVGGGVGSILNFSFNKKSELILALYAQYIENNYKTYSASSVFLTSGFNSFIYGGFDWHISDDITISFGGGSMFLINENPSCYKEQYSSYSYEYKYSQPYFFGITLKTSRIFNLGGRVKKDSFNTFEQSLSDSEIDDYYFHSKKYIDIKDYNGAEEILLEGLSKYPDDYSLNKQMGNVQYYKGNKSLAIFYYEKAFSLRPDDIILQEFINKLKGTNK